MKFVISSILALLFFSVTTPAQSTIAPEAVFTTWEEMATMVIGTAEAMPTKYYAYTPHKDLRDFASQIGHTTGANYLFASVVKLTAPDPMPTSDSKEKQQVIKELKASFEFISGGLKKLSPADLNEEIEFFGKTIPRLQAILMMTSHLQREHGKTITYVRIKGVAPARSAGW